MLGAFLRLLVLIAGGIILAQITSFSFIALTMEGGERSLAGLNSMTLRWILLIGHIFTFIIPCILFVVLNYKEKKWDLLRLKKKVNFTLLALCFLFCVVSYPAVTYSYTINSYIPLADFMINQESTTAATLAKVLEMPSLPVFLLNLVIIAIVPALGEELLFRGLIMDFVEKSSKNGHLAVWISAAAFSFFHLQFQGFLPRMLLGALLGYSFLYTRNLWVPILLHFINNAIPIAALYFADLELAALDPNESQGIHWSVGLVSALMGIGLLYYIRNKVREHEV